MLLLLLACADHAATCADAATCAPQVALFGAPNEATGLDASRCAPTCADCGGEPWTQPAWTADDLARWRAWTLIDPPAIPADDPYAAAAPAVDDMAVCAFADAGQGRYRLTGYPDAQQAERAGAQVTHYGTCGLCSSLQDLAVYAATPDLTAPVRDCGLQHLTGTVEELSACIEALGFTAPCARIWAYNTLHTRDACLAVCAADLDAPYNQPDGSLNPCLQCDEDESGAVFKAVAGRTRRNTGLASSICRPCSEVVPLEHRY